MTEAKPEEKMLFVKTAVKDLIKANECKTSSELLGEDGLNDVIKSIITKACIRAKANKRTTVFPKDL